MFRCKYCGRESKSKRGCSCHERYCKANPNRVKKKMPDGYISYFAKNNVNLDRHTYICEFCKKEFYMSLNNFKRHETFCKENPNRKKYKGHSLSEDVKHQLSELMKEKHKLGTAPTWAHLRGKNKISYPEQWLMKVIKNEQLNSNYIHEHPFYSFSLDFAWLEEKKVIEMDGRFHKISDKQKDCDKRKDELLEKDGWKELRIDWEYCCNNTKLVIEQIKEFLRK